MYDKAIELDPKNPIIYNNKGVSLNSLFKFDDAM